MAMRWLVGYVARQGGMTGLERDMNDLAAESWLEYSEAWMIFARASVERAISVHHSWHRRREESHRIPRSYKLDTVTSRGV